MLGAIEKTLQCKKELSKDAQENYETKKKNFFFPTK